MSTWILATVAVPSFQAPNSIDPDFFSPAIKRSLYFFIWPFYQMFLIFHVTKTSWALHSNSHRNKKRELRGIKGAKGEKGGPGRIGVPKREKLNSLLSWLPKCQKRWSPAKRCCSISGPALRRYWGQQHQETGKKENKTEKKENKAEKKENTKRKNSTFKIMSRPATDELDSFRQLSDYI